MYSRNQPRSRQLEIRPAGGDHQVVTVSSDRSQRRQPCAKPCRNCPWRIDAIGKFPAEAFVHSARTAYDMAETTFACHQAGASQPRMCAGFCSAGRAHHRAPGEDAW